MYMSICGVYFLQGQRTCTSVESTKGNNGPRLHIESGSVQGASMNTMFIGTKMAITACCQQSSKNRFKVSVHSRAFALSSDLF